MVTVFCSGTDFPAATDIATAPVALLVLAVKPAGVLTVKDSRVSFSVPYHMDTWVVHDCAEVVTPVLVRATLTISLSRSAMIFDSPSLLQRCTGAGVLHSLHTPSRFTRLHAHST